MSESHVDVFKPPHLDKLLLILQLLGVIHTKITKTAKPSQKLKHIALLAYNTLILHSNVIMMLVCIIVTVPTMKNGPKSFVNVIYNINNLMIYLWAIVAMTLMFVLSRKSKLQSIRKPKNWISLPMQFERKMPGCYLVCYSVLVISILSILLVSVIALISAATDIQGLVYKSCFGGYEAMDFLSNNTLNASLNLNKTSASEIATLNCALVLMIIFNMPSIFAMLIVPVYLLMWINYCRQLFRGINSELMNIFYGDSMLLKKCRCQYWAVCDLVDKINANYGCLTAWYVFTAVFAVFMNGYLVAKSAMSGNSTAIYHIITYLATVSIAIFLFFASCLLRSEVSTDYYF